LPLLRLLNNKTWHQRMLGSKRSHRATHRPANAKYDDDDETSKGMCCALQLKRNCFS